MAETTPSLATEAAAAGDYPSRRFNQRERKICLSVKTYVDANIGVPADGSITTAKLAANAVTTAKLANAAVTATQLGALAVTTAALNTAAVTLAKLAPGITPSHIVVFAGKYTTTGGSATETQTVTGVAATDIVLATLQAKGASPQTILTSAPTTNTLTYVFSGDPSTDHVVSYQVLRAAS